jgi:hypothetical protein
MEAIVKLKKTLKTNIQFSFKENKFYVTVAGRKNHFEPNLFGALVSLRDLKEVIYVYNMMATVVAELDLNTRIWSKR